MLAPTDRALLLETLRPPAGYQLDRAIGTSYSLDLLALLTAPLAFTFFDWEDEEGRPTADPVALLEAVRRHADRMLLFCEAGCIRLPPNESRLIAYLEPSVVPVRAPHEKGAFHPKTWLLRFTSNDGPVRYRFLCLSRNLTFDRSWDTVLALDGVLAERTNAIALNEPLSKFVGRLPDLAIHPLDPKTRAWVNELADEVRRVKFEPPPNLELAAFHPLGLGGRSDKFPIPKIDRPLLVVAPFVNAWGLARLVAGRSDVRLVALPEWLHELPANTLKAPLQAFVLDPAVDESEDAPGDPERLDGLHAKLFVMDDGWYARLWTGSANATSAAFESNVEFLVELRGLKSKVGIDAILGTDSPEEAPGLMALLSPYLRPEQPAAPDAARVAAEQRVEEARRALSREKLALRAVPSGDGLFDLALESPVPGLRPRADVAWNVWPCSLSRERAAAPAVGEVEIARWHALPLIALTAFLAVEITSGPVTQCFALRLPLVDAPADRTEQLLRHLLRNRDEVMRLLWLLLSRDELTVSEFVGAVAAHGTASDDQAAGGLGLPLVEALLDTVASDPARLDAVHRLVEDLRKTPEGQALLPEGFASIWDPVWRVRQEQGS